MIIFFIIIRLWHFPLPHHDDVMFQPSISLNESKLDLNLIKILNCLIIIQIEQIAITYNHLSRA